MRRSSKERWTFPATWQGRYTPRTSTPRTRSSQPEASGAYRTPSPAPLRNSTPYQWSRLPTNCPAGLPPRNCNLKGASRKRHAPLSSPCPPALPDWQKSKFSPSLISLGLGGSVTEINNAQNPCVRTPGGVASKNVGDNNTYA